MCVFGRPIKDFVPVLPERYHPHPVLQETLSAREEALRTHRSKRAGLKTPGPGFTKVYYLLSRLLNASSLLSLYYLFHQDSMLLNI